MIEIEQFEITPDGEVICNGALWSMREFTEAFGQWLKDYAQPGEYGIVAPEDEE